MTKEQIREKHLNLQGLSVNKSSIGDRIQKATFDAMEEYAKQRSKEFFKWYGVKMMEFLEYFQEKKRNPIPYSIPDAYDKYIEEFEGQSLDNLYELFLKSNELK